MLFNKTKKSDRRASRTLGERSYKLWIACQVQVLS